jgi:hypothetical protein
MQASATDTFADACELAFDAAGTRLAGVTPGTGEVAQWRGGKPEPPVLLGDKDCCTHVAFSPDGRQLAASSSGSAFVESNPRRDLLTYIRHQRVDALAFSAAGAVTIATSPPGLIVETEPANTVTKLGPFDSAPVLAAGRALVKKADGYAILVRKSAEGDTIPIQAREPIVSAAFIGDYLVGGMTFGAIRMWNAKGALVLDDKRRTVNLKALAVRGEWIAASWENVPVEVWRFALSAKPEFGPSEVLDGTAGATALAFDTQGRQLAVSVPKKLLIFNLKAGRP